MHHADGSLLARARRTLVLERQGIKMGFFGVGEQEW
jgi:hypothetical protein